MLDCLPLIVVAVAENFDSDCSCSQISIADPRLPEPQLVCISRITDEDASSLLEERCSSHLHVTLRANQNKFQVVFLLLNTEEGATDTRICRLAWNAQKLMVYCGRHSDYDHGTHVCPVSALGISNYFIFAHEEVGIRLMSQTA